MSVRRTSPPKPKNTAAGAGRVVAEAAEPSIREARWAEVLRAAGELFAEKGYAETSVQDLAVRAGLVNKGSLYYYIETKEDLLFELAIQAHTDVLEVLTHGGIAGGRDAPERLAALIDWWMRYQDATKAQSAWIERELRALSPDRLGAVVALRGQFEQYVADIIQCGIDEGSLAPDLDPRIVTKSIFILLKGTYEWYDDSGALAFDELIAWYQRLILKGIAADGRKNRKRLVGAESLNDVNSVKRSGNIIIARAHAEEAPGKPPRKTPTNERRQASSPTRGVS